MFHLQFSLPALIVLFRYVLPLPWSRSSKLALSAALLVASQYHVWSLLSSGSVFSPEFPRPVVIVFNWAFAAIFLLAIFQLALDLVMLLLVALRRQRMRAVPSVRYAIGAAAMLLAVIGVHQAIRVPPVKDVEIAVPGLPPSFDGYTIVHLTDLHISRLFDRPWVHTVVRDTNALHADLIVITGDLIDGTIAARTADVEPLRHLRAADGVLMSPGNHEYFFGYSPWMRHFASLGVTVLANDHRVIRRGGGEIAIAGLTDLTAPALGLPGPDIGLATRGKPAAAPVLLLDHHPKEAKRAAAAGVALQLSGHTHGGLVVGFDRLLALANGGFVSGLYDVAGMPLYVNNGTALWPGMALRLGKPSELTRITLRGTG